MKTCFLILILCVVALPLFSQSDTTKTQVVDSVVYTCPMHPDVVSNKPGKCPKCGMDLVEKKSSEPSEHEMNRMMCPMHGMVDMNHKHDAQKKDNMKMMKGMGIGAGVMMVVMMVVLMSN
jgi:putative DNA topoisomerase